MDILDNIILEFTVISIINICMHINQYQCIQRSVIDIFVKLCLCSYHPRCLNTKFTSKRLLNNEIFRIRWIWRSLLLFSRSERRRIPLRNVLLKKDNWIIVTSRYHVRVAMTCAYFSRPCPPRFASRDRASEIGFRIASSTSLRRVSNAKVLHRRSLSPPPPSVLRFSPLVALLWWEICREQSRARAELVFLPGIPHGRYILRWYRRRSLRSLAPCLIIRKIHPEHPSTAVRARYISVSRFAGSCATADLLRSSWI